MATQISNYKCPNCTGPLKFNPETEKIECEYCGSTFEVEQIEAMYADKNKAAQEAFEEEVEQEINKEETEWEMGFEDWGPGEGLKSYLCPSCGAEMICDDTTGATSCPYCGNPTIIPGQFTGGYKPDLVLPFRLERKDARKALNEYYKNKKLLPDGFISQNRIDEIKGVYVPFWLYNCTAEGDGQYMGTRSNSYTRGDYRITETEYFCIYRSGTMNFKNIPVDASTKMPDNYMDAVEPFDYDDLKKFSTAYLSGFLADKFDRTAEDCAPRADERARQSIRDALYHSVTGYGSVSEQSSNVYLQRGKVKYGLLPVYMLGTKWQGQDYMFAMNGQTGKFIGDLPVDMGKYWKYFGKYFALGTAVIGTLLMLVL